jgi:zinc and cadmium transporter
MANYWQVLFFSFIGSVFSLIGGVLLLSKKKTANLLAEYATPFAAGALLAAVFFDLLPEGIKDSKPGQILTSTLVGLLLFFYLERFLRWFHHHNHQRNTANSASINLIIIGDTLHNALDGVAIATAFLVSVPVGIVTTIAVAAHEIPQEIGDFGYMLAKGLKPKKVLLVNLISASSAIFMAMLTFWLGSADKLPVGILLGLSAGFLLYIATADIIPSIHETTDRKPLRDIRPLLLLIGVLVVALAVNIANRFIVA